MHCGSKKTGEKKPEHELQNFTDFAAPSWTMKQHSSPQRWNEYYHRFPNKLNWKRERNRFWCLHAHEQEKFVIRRIGHRVSRRPPTVITTNGSIDTREKATVFVKGWYIFVTVQLLEDTREFLSLWKTCEENWNSNDWYEGQTSKVINNCRIKHRNPTTACLLLFLIYPAKLTVLTQPMIQPKPQVIGTGWSIRKQSRLREIDYKICQNAWRNLPRMRGGIYPRMRGGIYDEFGGHKIKIFCKWKNRSSSSQQIEWEAQRMYTHSKGSKLQNLQSDKDYKSSVQTSYWKRQTSRSQIRWLDHDRPQSHQWRGSISQQWSKCNCCARFGRSMDSKLTMPNENCNRNDEELTKVCLILKSVRRW